MAKQIRQFRYYGEDNPKNYPSSLKNAVQLVQVDNIFQPLMPSSHIGIQSLPGTQFFINGQSNLRGIMLGHTGIYELDLGDDLSIKSLQFNMESLQNINKNDNAALFIDIIYEGEEEQ